MFISIFSLLLSCSNEEVEPVTQQSSTLYIRSTSFPVHYLVESMSKGHQNLDLSCILPVGEDAPSWNPNAEEVIQLQEANLIISNGANFEPFLQKISVEQQKIIDTSKGIQLIHIEGDTHSHGKTGAHSHEEMDPHTWLDPRAYLQQARNIKDALVAEDQSHRGLYNDKYIKIENDLQDLHRELLNVTTKLRRFQIAANHPVYNYFAKRFSLQIQSFDFDPEEMLSPEQIKEFHKYAQMVHENKKPAILWWESPPKEEIKQALEKDISSIEVIHVVLPPLEQPIDGSSYDYFQQSQDNIKSLESLVEKLSTTLKE